MISTYQSALSGLQTYAIKIQTNANNIANADTDCFKKSRVTAVNGDPPYVKAQVEKITSAGPTIFQETSEGLENVEFSNVDIGSEMVGMTLNSTMYKANLKTISAINEMTGELLKIKS